MYKNVLVPLALEEETPPDRSLAIARALKAEGGRVTLLHVMEEVPGFVSQHLPEGVMQKNFDAAREKVAALADPIGAKAEVVWGHAARTILDYAEEHGADCIVVASHKPGLQDYFLGSTAAHVVRHAGCSVHVIR